MNLPLFDSLPSARDFLKPNLRKGWQDFRAANPLVWRELIRRSLQLRINGVKRIGIATIWESMRYERLLKTTGKPWKLNNSWRAFAARELMAEVPGLEGLFEIRGVRS